MNYISGLCTLQYIICDRKEGILGFILNVNSSFYTCSRDVLKQYGESTFHCHQVQPGSSSLFIKYLMMTQTSYCRRKPLAILVGLSVCLILWVAFQHNKRVPLERSGLTVTKEQFMLEARPLCPGSPPSGLTLIDA